MRQHERSATGSVGCQARIVKKDLWVVQPRSHCERAGLSGRPEFERCVRSVKIRRYCNVATRLDSRTVAADRTVIERKGAQHDHSSAIKEINTIRKVEIQIVEGDRR